MITGWPSGPSTFSPVFGSTSSRSSWALGLGHGLEEHGAHRLPAGEPAGSGGRPRSSRADLAKKTGVTEASVAMTESGTRKNPSLPTLTRLARALGVPVTELLE